MFTVVRSAEEEPDCVPATSPRLRRRLSAWPPHRLLEPAPELSRILESGHVLHPGPYPPDWSRRHRYGASTTDSLALRLLTLLAGPGPSGSADPSRRCRGCFPPSPAIPGSGCLQLHRASATARQVKAAGRPAKTSSNGSKTSEPPKVMLSSVQSSILLPPLTPTHKHHDKQGHRTRSHNPQLHIKRIFLR